MNTAPAGPRPKLPAPHGPRAPARGRAPPTASPASSPPAPTEYRDLGHAFTGARQARLPDDADQSHPGER